MRRVCAVCVLAMGCGGASALVGPFGCQSNTYVTNVYEQTLDAGKDGTVEGSPDSSGNDAGEPDGVAHDGAQDAPDGSSGLACGDGLVMGPDGGTCSQRDTACDMTGYWAARETSYAQDTVIGAIQTSSAWTLFHFEQTGNDFHVVEELDCGERITGSATVDFTQAAFIANMYLNRQDGVADDAGVVHAARHGTSTQVAGGCAVTLDTWYKLRGATDAYLPADFTTNPPLSSLMPLPTVMSWEPDSGEWPDGATDPDHDGIPGIAYQISGLLNAQREVVEREWQGYATPAGAPVPASAVTMVVPDGHDDQQSTMRVLGCTGGSCSLAAAGSVVSKDHPAHITLTFIGKTYGSARVAPVVAGVPRQSVALDQTTCANVQLLLPHVPCPDPCASDAGLSAD